MFSLLLYLLNSRCRLVCYFALFATKTKKSFLTQPSATLGLGHFLRIHEQRCVGKKSKRDTHTQKERGRRMKKKSGEEKRQECGSAPFKSLKTSPRSRRAFPTVSLHHHCNTNNVRISAHSPKLASNLAQTLGKQVSRPSATYGIRVAHEDLMYHHRCRRLQGNWSAESMRAIKRELCFGSSRFACKTTLKKSEDPRKR